MASPVLPRDETPAPALLAPATARTIRDALVGKEREEFEQRFAQEMASAGRTLDLTGVLQVLSVFRQLAEITKRQGSEAHLRMLEQVDRLQRGQDVPTVPGHVLNARINERLGLGAGALPVR